METLAGDTPERDHWSNDVVRSVYEQIEFDIQPDPLDQLALRRPDADPAGIQLFDDYFPGSQERGTWGWHFGFKQRRALDEFRRISSNSAAKRQRQYIGRLMRAAIRYALDNKRRSVTLVHKGNIMKFTEGAFRNWGYQLAERDFADQTYTWGQWERKRAEAGEAAANDEQSAALASGRVLIKDAIADITLQQVLTRPAEFDVIATMNLNGDYLSDALAAQVGGIGIAPGGNINYASGNAVFEATHGTAPKYANKDMVNPGSLILSGEMMFRHLGWTEAADLLIKSMNETIARKTVTYDFARLMEGATKVKTSEFGDALIANM